MRGISGKQLAGDLINFVFGSFRSQIKAGTLTANRSVTIPDQDGAVVFSEFPVSFAAVVLLQGNKSYPTQTVTGAIVFTLSGSTKSACARTIYRLIANGANIPTFTGFAERKDSTGWDNRNGSTNLIIFEWDGTTAWYQIIQPATSAPNWIDVVFQNGFTNFGGIYPPMRYLSSGGQVFFRGLIQKSFPITVETTIFALPSNLAPVSRITILVTDVTSPAANYRIDVLTNGNVVLVPFTTAPSTGTCFPSFSCSYWIL